MFTGIIEAIGTVQRVENHGSNRIFWITSPLSHELRPDQSLSHDGVCLTVEEISGGQHRVTAIAETLSKTNLAQWQAGTRVNLERCLALNGRLDGHLVQGHVDSTGLCEGVTERDGSREYRFSFPPSFASYLIEKGSIAVNGTSLTAFNVTDHSFTVAIIPYTLEHTSIGQVTAGSVVNLEFDMIGKYVARNLQGKAPAPSLSLG